jgi:hypothetical protein
MISACSTKSMSRLPSVNIFSWQFGKKMSRAPVSLAAAAARHATDSDIAEMRDAIERMKKAFGEKKRSGFLPFQHCFF